MHHFRASLPKTLTKLAILPDYKCPGMLYLALAQSHKITKLDFHSEFSMSKSSESFEFFFIEEKEFRSTYHSEDPVITHGNFHNTLFYNINF